MTTLTSTKFLQATNNTANFFGFQTVDQIKKHPACRACCERRPHSVTGNNKRLDAQQGLLSSAVATYCDEKLHALPNPVLLYGLERVPRTGETAVTFHVFNVERSIAEVLLIHAGRALLNELGVTDHTVRINSLGDSESTTRFSREVSTFLRKNINNLPPKTREAMKIHPLEAFGSLMREDNELTQRTPKPLEYLSDPSRKHFREIVEYLDMSETPYEIDHKVLGHHECYSNTVFSFETADNTNSGPAITIEGGRFDEFFMRTTNHRTPAVGMVVTLKNSQAPSRSPKLKSSTPALYIVQLGFGPKIRSLMLIDSLRQAGISTHHNLASDSLSEQLRDAEAREVPYTLIIGQKEYVEKTVILRDMQRQNQEYIDQSILIRHLRKQFHV